MRDFVSEKFGKLLTPRFFKFCVVGGLGFLLDVAVTLALIGFGTGPFFARIVAIGSTIMFCWRLNRWLTFETSAGSELYEGLRYFCVAALIGLLNYLVYALILILWPLVWPMVAITVATGACTIVSYLAFARFAFRPA